MEVGGPNECPDNAACAVPDDRDALTPSEDATTPPRSVLPPRVGVFARVGAPDGSNSVPLLTTYLNVADSGDRLSLRIEYADLCQRLLGVHVVETADTVTVTGVGTPAGDGLCPLRLLVATGTVALDAPLGDRTVTTP
jgi:hypothetical protein